MSIYTVVYRGINFRANNSAWDFLVLSASLAPLAPIVLPIFIGFRSDENADPTKEREGEEKQFVHHVVVNYPLRIIR